MKSTLLSSSIVMFLCSSFASAQVPKSIEKVNVDCDDVKLSINTVMNDRFNFSAYWNVPSTFPDPPKYIEVGDTIRSDIKRFKFDCPNYSVSYDGDIAEIKADSFEEAIRHLSEYDKELNLYFHGWYTYPNIKKGFNSVNYSFNIDNFNLKTNIYNAEEGKDLSGDSRFFEIPKTAIIGYKIDGSKIKPLLYNRKIGYYKADMTSANVIDIFHKNNDDNFKLDEVIQRIHIDKSKGLIRIYRNYPFPKS